MRTKDTGRDSALSRLIPERIKEAREARGFSAEDFGEIVGVTRQSVAQYETGQISPSPEVLSRIIAATRQPMAFFVSPRRRKADSSSTPFWRSLKRMEQTDRARITRRIEWAADIVDYIDMFIELPDVNIPDLQWDVEGGIDEDIEEIALRVRTEWNLGYGPIHDMVPLLESNGIVLIRETVRCEDMDAVSRWQMGRPYILYSREIVSQARVNFNLAHELAHLILHSGVDVNSSNINKLERQANRFAGAFLLPRLTFPKEIVSTSINYFINLKSRWRVSIGAMVYRCKDLGILNDFQVKYLWRQMNVMGIRKFEPLDDQYVISDPKILRAALKMLVDHKIQSKGDIEDALNLSSEDIESISGTENGWLSADKIIQFVPRPSLRTG